MSSVLFDEKFAWHLLANCNCPSDLSKQHPFLITHEADVAFLTVLDLRVLGADDGYVLFENGRVIYIAGDLSLEPITYYVFEVPRSEAEAIETVIG